MVDLDQRGKLTRPLKPEDIENLNPFNKEWRSFYYEETKKALFINDKIPVKLDYMKVKEIGNLREKIDSVASKTIYALHLINGDTTPNTPGIYYNIKNI